MINLKRTFRCSLALAITLISSLHSGSYFSKSLPSLQEAASILFEHEIDRSLPSVRQIINADFKQGLTYIESWMQQNSGYAEKLKNYLAKNGLIKILQVISDRKLTNGKLVQQYPYKVGTKEFQGQKITEFNFNVTSGPAAFSADNVNFVDTTMSCHSQIVAYNLTTQTLNEFPQMPYSDSIAFHPKKPFVALGQRYDDHAANPTFPSRIHILDASTINTEVVLPVGYTTIRALLFSENGRFLYAGIDNMVIRFDLENLDDQEELILRISNKDAISALAFMPDGRLVVGTYKTNMVMLYDLNDPQKPISSFDCTAAVAEIPDIPQTDGPYNAQIIKSISASNDNQRVMIISSNYCTYVWNIQENNFVLLGDPGKDQGWSSAASSHAQFFAGGYSNSTCVLWDAKTADSVELLPPLPQDAIDKGYESCVYILTLNFNPDCSGIYLAQKYWQQVDLYYFDFTKILEHLSLGQIYFALKIYQYMNSENHSVDLRELLYYGIYKSFNEIEQSYIENFLKPQEQQI